MIPFNVKKHSDLVITVQGEVAGDERTFHLHKFPLISKSQVRPRGARGGGRAHRPRPHGRASSETRLLGLARVRGRWAPRPSTAGTRAPRGSLRLGARATIWRARRRARACRGARK